jgi:predicted N-acetyltransferase YhbS
MREKHNVTLREEGLGDIEAVRRINESAFGQAVGLAPMAVLPEFQRQGIGLNGDTVRYRPEFTAGQ